MRFFGVSSMLQVVCNSCIFNSLVSSEIKACLRDVNLPIGSNYRLQSMLYSQKHFFSSIQHNCTYTDVNSKNAVVGSCVKDKTTSNLMPPLPGGIWRPFLVWEWWICRAYPTLPSPSHEFAYLSPWRCIQCRILSFLHLPIFRIEF